jgi:hypothetical protein
MKKYKLEYVETENGLEALRAYQTAQVQFDIILMGETLDRVASECRF